MNDSGDGTSRLIFNGAPKRPVKLVLAGDQITAALTVMRTVMRTVHIEEIGNSRTNRFDATNAKKLKDFIDDLRTVAVEGARLWHSLWEDRMDEWLDNEAMFVGGSQTINIARKHKSTHIYPWAMVYDLPVYTGEPARNTLCSLLGEPQWKQFQSAKDFPRRCPFEAAHTKGVICPYGFWGFRYAIEHPISRPSTYVDKPIRAEPKPLTVIAALAEDLNGTLLKSHLDELKTHSGYRIRECRTRDAIEDGLGLVDLALAYFYCHGLTLELPGKAGVAPRLGVGKEEIIEPPDLSTWRRTEWPRNHWKDVAPLVFINGCHTADSSPQTLVNFVDTFAGSLGAPGVIGTEITVDQLVANEVGQVFLDCFRYGLTVGESMHRVRVRLLKKGNLLGLVYTAHCAAGLSLSASVA
jgi:hypothetical protein